MRSGMRHTHGRSARGLALLCLILPAVLAACERAAGNDDAQARERRTGFRGVLLDAPLEADFTLTDTRGRPFRFRDEARNNVALLFFGYTHCPDVCPVHLSNLAAVIQRLPYAQRSRIRVVFVTTDPVRDTAQRIREWLDAMDPSFIGLRGTVDEVTRIQHALHLPAAALEAARPDGGYDVGHAAQVLAFTDGVARVAYPFGTRQTDWLHDLPILLVQLED
jgi:protein SCO1/2